MHKFRTSFLTQVPPVTGRWRAESPGSAQLLHSPRPVLGNLTVSLPPHTALQHLSLLRVKHMN